MRHQCDFLCPSRFFEGARAYHEGSYAGCPDHYCRNERATWAVGRACADRGESCASREVVQRVFPALADDPRWVAFGAA